VSTAARGIDALISGRTMVFRAAGSEVSVAPIVSRQARGARVSFNF
jgi:hypothetical protein